MEQTAYDEICLDDISFENDFGIDLELDGNASDISFEGGADELTLDDLEPDEDLEGIAFENEPDDELTLDLDPDDDTELASITFEEPDDELYIDLEIDE